MAWLDGASAHEDVSFPFGDTADDESRIFVMDMTACGAYVARKGPRPGRLTRPRSRSECSIDSRLEWLNAMSALYHRMPGIQCQSA
jgi:hypothetical protein